MMETKNIVCRQQQESDEEPEKMIDQFVKKLKMEKYPDILNKIQKQYNKWKRGKK